MTPSIPPSSTSSTDGPDTFTRRPKRLKKSEHQEKLNSLVGIPSDPKAMILEHVGDFIPQKATMFTLLGKYKAFANLNRFA